MNKKLPSAIRHIADIAKDDEVYESINEDLRAWFGKGKKGGAGGGGWDRYNTKGERVGKCGLQTESLEVDESEYDAFDIMHEDPPIGVDFDMDNLPKVDWSKHSPEEIKSFYSTIENLDFDDSKDITGTGYSGAWAEALKWLDDNVMNKLDKDIDEALTEEQFDEAAGEKDACYHKVKSRYKVWPSAYASGALVKCRKVGAANWGNSKK